MKKILEMLALSAALLSPLSGGIKANAQDVTSEQVIELEAESNTKKPQLEIIFNYKKETQQKSTDYLTSKNAYIREIEHLWRHGDIPELNFTERDQVESIISDIQNSNIGSYQELVEISQHLSESQKLVLSSAIGNTLNMFNYDLDLQDNEVVSQDDFFYNLQDSLESGNEIGLGVCRQIATHIEKFLNDIGVRSAAVTGILKNGVGHMYDVSKIENGTAIVDSFNILTTDTQNIEKALEAYQKYNGTTTFQHSFFEDSKFKYLFTTTDGKHFLDFIEYDTSSEPLKEALIHRNETEASLTIAVNLEDYLTSFETNILGFFAKIGEIRGDNSSPLKKMGLFQAGFKRNFSILDAIKINPSLSFLYGGISQDTKLDNNELFGVNGNLIIATNNTKGFNLSSRIAGTIFKTEEADLFHDFVFGGGISYKIPFNSINIEPYITAQFSLVPQDLGTYNFTPKLTEFEGGIIFNGKLPDTNVSFNPYYIKRIWEQEFGGNFSLNGENAGINIKGFITKSNYDFCPDKYEINLGSYLNLKNLTINASFNMNETNYYGERKNQKSFKIGASIKF